MAHLAPTHDASQPARSVLAAVLLASLEAPSFGDWTQSSQELRQGAFISELDDGLGEFDACRIN